jgi:hypothetical protein
MTTLPCPPQLWPRFSALLDEVLDLPERDHAGWLSGLDEADAPLRPWLRRALEEAGAGAATSSGFFELRENLIPLESILRPGDVIGPFRLEALIGEGGMGQVWRAGRPGDDGPQRQVALKLPHSDWLGGLFKARFRRERDVLARLSHPNIAQLYDAGVSAEGIPYLALELVQGATLLEHCRATQATLEQRLELIAQMLGALSYAHERLIVHRDIKPSNILVTADCQVKLLDFGIAKLLREENATDQKLTQGAPLATPRYGAPEQFNGGTVTVAADVFSTGVVLFELLTGELPFETIPRDQEAPPAPLASRRAQPERIACPDRRLRRALAGDLDAIIAKALALNPEHRYRSAEAFRRDVQRWLGGQPVAARRVGWATLSLKFARRNKVGVALAAVLGLALAGGTAGIAWQARVAAREATRAEQEAARAGHEAARAGHEAARANAVKNYLIGLFEQGDPNKGVKPSETMTVKELLDRGTEQIDAALAGQPETEIELLDTLGQIYTSLEDPGRAAQTDTRRVQLARTLYGADDPRVVGVTLDLAESQTFFVDTAGARALLASIRQSVFTHYAADSLERARWLTDWAETLRTIYGPPDEALADASQAVMIFRSHFPQNDHYSDALDALAGLQYDTEQYDAAWTTFQEIQKMLAAHGDTAGIDELEYLAGAGATLRHLRRPDEADKTLTQLQALAEHLVGRQSVYYISGLMTKAEMLNDLGRRDQAIALFTEGAEIASGRGATAGWVTTLRSRYGKVLATDGDAAAAIPLLENALREAQSHAKDVPALPFAKGALGDAYDQVGNIGKARALLLAARNEWMQYGLPHSNQMLNARARWAQFLLDHGDVAGAAMEYAAIPPATIVPGPAAALAQAGLARIALLRGDVAGADAASDDALRRLDQIKIQYDIRVRADLWLTRAECLNAMGRKDAASALLQQASQLLAKSDAPQSARLARAQALTRSVGRGIENK